MSLERVLGALDDEAVDSNETVSPTNVVEEEKNIMLLFFGMEYINGCYIFTEFGVKVSAKFSAWARLRDRVYNSFHSFSQ